MDGHADTAALIGNIYEAGLDGSRWPAFMEKLASTLHAGFGNLWLLDVSNWSFSCEDGGAVSSFSGLDSSTVGRYKEHYASLNVWLPNALNLAEGDLTISSALYPDRLLKGTEFYDVFLRPNDLFYAVGSSVVKRGTTDVRMSFVRSEHAGRYTAAELRLVKQLMPHLRNAVVLHRELYRTRLMASSAMATLELVPVGLVLLTGSGLLAHANLRAHELFARTGALRFGPGGTLHAASPTATTSLQRLIQDAVRTGTGKGLAHGGTLRLRGAGGRMLQVLVSPLTPDSGFEGNPMAAIFCSDPDAVVGQLSQRLERMYQMTPAEAQLTEALVNGKSLQEHAEARSVSMNTVRTQLKSAAAKTGARRQADLVRIVLTGPAIFNQPTS
jgi:DNA-binding CsgD family transcriptional regulator